MHIKEYSVPGVCIRHQQALCWFYGAPCKTRLVPYIIIHNRYIAITCLNQVGKEYQRQKKPRVEVTRTDNIAWTVAYSVCSFFLFPTAKRFIMCATYTWVTQYCVLIQRCLIHYPRNKGCIPCCFLLFVKIQKNATRQS